ncbi:MAG: chromosomal replication initiator protein DnaA [Nitrospirota bacterium]
MKVVDLTLAWNNVLLSIKDDVDANSLDYFTYTKLNSIVDNDAIIAVPNQFFADIIRDRYYDAIQMLLEKEIGFKINRIQFIVNSDQTKKNSNYDLEKSSQKNEKKRGGLNPNYNFSSFVVGKGSEFAYAASLKVAESPGKEYNPLFIYGDVGLGKTHLLSAIGNYFEEKNPNRRMVYITAEQFTNDVVTSIRYNKMVEFHHRYRSIDLLLIDDIQFIGGKVATQEEFFHTFNTLYEDDKQIVVSADRPAKEMSDIEGRLWSRFKMGLTADIQSPNLETRIAILYKKAEAEEMVLTQDVALFIAENIHSNVREMEGALIRLSAHHSLMKQEMTLDLAKHLLRDTIVITKREISIEEVQKKVADHFQMKLSDLKSKRRTKTIVFPRQIAMYICRELTKASFPEIGEAFGGKDHSTVIHSCKLIEKDKAKDTELNATLGGLIQKISGEGK